MLKFKPFQAVRPPRALAGLVSTRSYITYQEKDLWLKLQTNPYSLMHVLNTPAEEGGLHFSGVRKAYEEFMDMGYLQHDDEATYYVYRKQRVGHVFTGIIGLASLQDYNEGRIKPHEATLAKRETLFAKYLDVVGFHAEPVLLTHSHSDDIADILIDITATRPDVEFATTDQAVHSIWPVPSELTPVIENLFAQQDNLYVADGHHRLASSARLGATDGVMAFVLDEDQLRVSSFHRIIRELPHHGWLKFAKELPGPPEQQPHDSILAVHQGKWWMLDASMMTFPESHWLLENILQPCYQVDDERHDERMRYLPGVMAPADLVDELTHEETAFILPDPYWSDVRHWADQGRTVPPKSTYIEPKLRSGLALYTWK